MIFFKHLIFGVILLITIFSTTCSNTTKPHKNYDYGWKRIELGGIIFPDVVSSDRLYVAYENGVAIFDDMTQPPNLDVKLDIAYSDIIISYFPGMTHKMIAYHSSARSYNLHISEFESNNFISVGSSDFSSYYGENYEVIGVVRGIELDADKKIHRFYASMKNLNEISTTPLFIVYFDVFLDNDNNLQLINKGVWEFLSNNIHVFHIGVSIRYQNMVLYSYYNAYYQEQPAVAVLYDDLTFIKLDYSQPPFIRSFWIWNDVLYAQRGASEVHFSQDGLNWEFLGNFDILVSNGVEIDGYLFFSNRDQQQKKEYVNILEKRNNDIYLYQHQFGFDENIISINKYQHHLVVTTNYAVYYNVFDDIINKKKYIKKISL